MYVRSSNTGARTIKLPENYSGNAFSSHSPYSDMPPPTRTAQPKSDIPYEPPAKQNAISHSEESEETFSLHPLTDRGGEEKNSGDALSASSVFSSLLPRSDLSRHFPFGHGIGKIFILIG